MKNMSRQSEHSSEANMKKYGFINHATIFFGLLIASHLGTTPVDLNQHKAQALPKHIDHSPAKTAKASLVCKVRML